MKYSRHFCAATILTLALAFPAFAGDMGYPVAPPEPPPQQTTAGDMGYPIKLTDDEDYSIPSDINPLAEFARNFITVLSAF